MTKKELLVEIIKLSDYNDDLIQDLKSAMDTAKSIRALIDELPGDESEIEEPEPDDSEK